MIGVTSSTQRERKMANRYWAGPKAPKKEVREALMAAAVDITDSHFTVAFESDDTGSHVVVYIERNPDGTKAFSESIAGKFMGWRVIHMNVPDGYIPVFFNEDGTRTTTKRVDDDY